MGQIARYTVSVNPLRLLAAAVRARGVDDVALMARHGIGQEELADLEAHVPLRTACELCEEAARILDEPNIGLVVGARPPVGEGIVAYALQACPTIGAAWRLVIRYHRLITDVFEPRLTEEGGRGRLILYTPVADPEPLRHLSEAYLAKFVFMARTLTGIDCNPIGVHFRHAMPDDPDEHRRYFRAPLMFGHAVDGLVVERGLLKLPLCGDEPRLLHILDRYAADVLQRLPPTSDFGMAVRFAIATSLRHQEPTLERLAAHFHTSARTLQRRLADAGVSLRRLIDDARHELALRYLERDDLSVSEIGLLLGFDSKQSFHRAFRRWSGTTPGEMRRSMKLQTLDARR